MEMLENSENNFEKAWQQAIDGKEKPLPPHLWKAIEGNLTHQELILVSKRAFWYKWAAVLAVFMTGAMAIYILSLDKSAAVDGMIAQSNESLVPDSFELTEVREKIKTASFQPSANDNTKQRKTIDMSSAITTDDKSESTTTGFVTNMIILSKKVFGDEWINASVASAHQVNLQKAKPLDRFIPNIRSLSKNEDDPVIKSKEKQYWATVAGGGGSFNPNYAQQQLSPLAMSITNNERGFSLQTNVADANVNSQSDLNENMQAGLQRQIAIGMGTRLAGKWTVETGLTYGNATLTSQTNLSMNNRLLSQSVPITGETSAIGALNELTQEELVKYEYQDISLRNQFQFLHMPLKAGYILIDQKWNIRLHGGVQTNFYLGNTLTAQDYNIASISVSPGENSPYRNVSFSGLASVALGYELSKKVDFVVEPGYIMAIQNLTKADTYFSTNPSGMTVHAGLRLSIR